MKKLHVKLYSHKNSWFFIIFRYLLFNVNEPLLLVNSSGVSWKVWLELWFVIQMVIYLCFDYFEWLWMVLSNVAVIEHVNVNIHQAKCQIKTFCILICSLLVQSCFYTCSFSLTAHFVMLSWLGVFVALHFVTSAKLLLVFHLKAISFLIFPYFLS